VDAGGVTSSNHKACGSWEIELMKRPIQIVEIREAYHAVRGRVLEQQRVTGLAKKVVGTMPELAIEKKGLAIGHLQLHQVATHVPLPSPPDDVFVGRLIA